MSQGDCQVFNKHLLSTLGVQRTERKGTAPALRPPLLAWVGSPPGAVAAQVCEPPFVTRGRQAPRQ